MVGLSRELDVAQASVKALGHAVVEEGYAVETDAESSLVRNVARRLERKKDICEGRTLVDERDRGDVCGRDGVGWSGSNHLPSSPSIITMTIAMRLTVSLCRVV